MNNGKHRTSLKDLAKQLGVSIATVSRALRNSPEIGLDMQQRVKALAKELNEHPQKQGDNGNWWKWNTTTKMYEDTGIPAKGGMLYPTMWIDGNALYLEDNESSAASHLSYDGNALYLVI